MKLITNQKSIVWTLLSTATITWASTMTPTPCWPRPRSGSSRYQRTTASTWPAEQSTNTFLESQKRTDSSSTSIVSCYEKVRSFLSTKIIIFYLFYELDFYGTNEVWVCFVRTDCSRYLLHFFYNFANLSLRNLVFPRTYPKIYRHSWTSCMPIYNTRSYWSGTYLSHTTTRETCTLK